MKTIPMNSGLKRVEEKKGSPYISDRLDYAGHVLGLQP